MECFDVFKLFILFFSQCLFIFLYTSFVEPENDLNPYCFLLKLSLTVFRKLSRILTGYSTPLPPIVLPASCRQYLKLRACLLLHLLNVFLLTLFWLSLCDSKIFPLFFVNVCYFLWNILCWPQNMRRIFSFIVKKTRKKNS